MPRTREMTPTALFVQEACYFHRYIRAKDDSAIVERPERIRSVAIGLGAAIARLEELVGTQDVASLKEEEEEGGFRPILTRTPSTFPHKGIDLDLVQVESPLLATAATPDTRQDPETELTTALDRLTIGGASQTRSRTPAEQQLHIHTSVDIVRSTARASLLSDPAVKYIHGDIDGPGYIDNFVKWSTESAQKISQGQSEIPEGLHQLDLYLCPQSQDAVSGALGTVCQAVNTVMRASAAIVVDIDETLSGTGPNIDAADADNANSGNAEVSLSLPLSEEKEEEEKEAKGGLSTSVGQNVDSQLPVSNHRHAFVAVRPPGHHCGEDTPSGFCFVNNVMVGAAHAHLKHGINRVIVFDIDLHHGNGTQSIAWAINEEAYRAETEEGNEAPETEEPLGNSKKLSNDSGKNHLKVFYGSLHDVLSYPCEDGKPALIQAASTSLRGPHGQWLENIHLLPYESDEEFYKSLYPQYLQLIERAEDFVKSTAENQDVLVFISCGFDASQHEYPYMSRHGRRVPTSFYYRFTSDVNKFAEKYAKGRVISVLEGGYSQRALSSGAFAHLVGLVDSPPERVDETWWNDDNILKLEKVTKPKSRRSSAIPIEEAWLDRTLQLLPMLDVTPAKAPSRNKLPTAPPPERMTLRERKKVESSPQTSSPTITSAPRSATRAAISTSPLKGKEDPTATNEEINIKPKLEDVEPRKLPKVILHVKAPGNPH